jgi:prepilin-type N-terminal cleavage/methylation domain-containing protein
VKRRRSAFTLLEVLLALSMAAVLIGSLYASMRIAFDSQKSVAAALEPVQAMDAAIGLIARDLESAPPPNGVFAGSLLGTDETGSNGNDADTLVFYSASNIVRYEYDEAALALSGASSGSSSSPRSTGNVSSSKSGGLQSRSPLSSTGLSTKGSTVKKNAAADLQQVQYSLSEPSADGQSVDLVRSVTRLLSSQEAPEPEQTLLVRDVRVVKWRYFDGTDWLDEWDSANYDSQLPPSVELTLEIGDGAGATHKITRIFQMPCSIGAGEEGAKVTR